MTTKQRLQDAAELSARMARAFPGMGILWCADKALELCRIECAQRLHAERECSDAWYHHQPSEGGRSARDRAEIRIARSVHRWLDSIGNAYPMNNPRTNKADWTLTVQESPTDRACWHVEVVAEGDPRGAVLKVRLPGEAEAVAV